MAVSSERAGGWEVNDRSNDKMIADSILGMELNLVMAAPYMLEVIKHIEKWTRLDIRKDSDIKLIQELAQSAIAKATQP